MKKNIFSVGTGRCGTKFLFKLFEQDSKAAAFHEAHPFHDTFHRYCKWYDLPIDHAGFIKNKYDFIEHESARKEFFYESSAFLSFSLKELNENLDSYIILLVRHPKDVINSYIRKGWYNSEIPLKDSSKIPSPYEFDRTHHFLGRTIPKGEEFIKWNNYSIIGKLAWFWKTVNYTALNLLSQLPENKIKVIQIENFNYESYKDLYSWIGESGFLSEKKFEKLRNSKTNSNKGIFTRPKQWTDTEMAEYKHELNQIVDQFGYSL